VIYPYSQNPAFWSLHLLDTTPSLVGPEEGLLSRLFSQERIRKDDGRNAPGAVVVSRKESFELQRSSLSQRPKAGRSHLPLAI
jgi:hypothetical protein